MSKSTEVFIAGLVFGLVVGALATGKSVNIPVTVNKRNKSAEPDKHPCHWTFDMYWDAVTSRREVRHTNFSLDLEASRECLFVPYVYRNERLLAVVVPGSMGDNTLLIRHTPMGLEFSNGPMSSCARNYRGVRTIYQLLQYLGKTHAPL